MWSVFFHVHSRIVSSQFFAKLLLTFQHILTNIRCGKQVNPHSWQEHMVAFMMDMAMSQIYLPSDRVLIIKSNDKKVGLKQGSRQSELSRFEFLRTSRRSSQVLNSNVMACLARLSHCLRELTLYLTDLSSSRHVRPRKSVDLDPKRKFNYQEMDPS